MARRIEITNTEEEKADLLAVESTVTGQSVKGWSLSNKLRLAAKLVYGLNWPVPIGKDKPDSEVAPESRSRRKRRARGENK